MRARVIQSIETSPMHDNDATFSLAVWVGSLGGGALPTDPNPNTTPPIANRIARVTARRGATQIGGSGGLRTQTVAIAGGSVTYQIWFFDSTQNAWIQFNAPATINAAPGQANAAVLTIGNMAGAKVFAQLTAVTNVEQFGYDYV